MAPLFAPVAGLARVMLRVKCECVEWAAFRVC